MHCRIRGRSRQRPDEAGAHSDATTVIDQGIAGPWTVDGFKAYFADSAETDVQSFVSATIARAMMDKGVLPNAVGSDVHADFNAYHDDSKLDYSLCGAMTRLVALRFTLADVIRRTTLNPAKILREED